MRDRILFALLPLFFASNLLIGRPAVAEVGPWTLAWMRWSSAAILLLAFAGRDPWRYRQALLREWRAIVVLGFLGMVVCGGSIYLGLRYTTAANATLIYAASNVFVLIIEAVVWKRPIVARQWLGVALAWAGVAAVVFGGGGASSGPDHWRGDALILLGASGWAGYSILLRRPAFVSLPSLTLFAMIASAGAVLAAVPAIGEIARTHPFPHSAAAWGAVGAIILIPSIAAFWSYQVLVGRFGAATASGFIYLVPAYGVGLAAVALGEKLVLGHLLGFVGIAAGLALVSRATGRPSAQAERGAK